MGEPLLRRVARRAANLGPFAVGLILAVLLVGGAGEAFLRISPPGDNREYLGMASPLTGPFVPDAEFGVAYRSWQALQDDYAERLAAYAPLNEGDGRPTWALFGSSFVHMHGMLADTARERLPGVRVFNLGRNEPLVVRFAQLRLLLEHGLRPQHVFATLMPLDVANLGRQPLATLRVSTGGALAYEPRLPPAPLDGLVRNSALARTAWFRSGRQAGEPDFHYLRLHDAVPDGLRADLAHLFGGIARLSREYEVPVTVVLIPTLEQLLKGARFAFQDAVGPLAREAGLGVCDPRGAFLACPDRAALLLPDKHLAPVGNRILLDELLAHLGGRDTLFAAAAAGRR
jgi:hypothetical protein